jgi:hypothetical protein
MQPLVTFGIGMVGAVAPEIVRLYTLRSQDIEKFSAFYVLISFVFAGLGGLVALILPATTLWGAFYAGISTPVVISTALKKGMGQKGDDVRDRQEGAPSPPASGSASLAKFVKAL